MASMRRWCRLPIRVSGSATCRARVTSRAAATSTPHNSYVIIQRGSAFSPRCRCPIPKGGLSEIAYAFDVLKADGIGLMTNDSNKWPGDAAFTPIFEELNRRGGVVYFHPTTASCCQNVVAGVPDVVLEYPHDTTRAVASLLYSERWRASETFGSSFRTPAARSRCWRVACNPAPPSSDCLLGRLRAVFTRRALGRVHLRRIEAIADLRAGVSRGRSRRAGVE